METPIPSLISALSHIALINTSDVPSGFIAPCEQFCCLELQKRALSVFLYSDLITGDPILILMGNCLRMCVHICLFLCTSSCALNSHGPVQHL